MTKIHSDIVRSFSHTAGTPRHRTPHTPHMTWARARGQRAPRYRPATPGGAVRGPVKFECRLRYDRTLRTLKNKACAHSNGHARSSAHHRAWTVV